MSISGAVLINASSDMIIDLNTFISSVLLGQKGVVMVVLTVCDLRFAVNVSHQRVIMTMIMMSMLKRWAVKDLPYEVLVAQFLPGEEV